MHTVTAVDVIATWHKSSAQRRINDLAECVGTMVERVQAEIRMLENARPMAQLTRCWAHQVCTTLDSDGLYVTVLVGCELGTPIVSGG